MYLLDTNVVAELRKGHTSGMAAWAASVPQSLMYLSVVLRIAGYMLLISLVLSLFINDD